MKVRDGELVDGTVQLADNKYHDDLTPEARKTRHLLEDCVENGRKGGLQTATKKAPEDCLHCRMMGYTNWMQHIGHLGFAAMLRKTPQAAHIVRAIIKHYPLPPAPEPEIPF